MGVFFSIKRIIIIISLKSELKSANKLEAINTLAVPVVTYSFDIINWTLQELAKLDTKTRRFLTTYKMHHPKSDVDRLYLPITEGGRGLIQLELSSCKSQPVNHYRC